MKKILILFAALFVLYGCKGEMTEKAKEEAVIKVQTINAAEAKKIMDENPDALILDVRTQEEYDEGHIANAVLIPDYELQSRAEKEISDKESLILVYCRSGRRSKASAQLLSDMGYANVYDFGGIIDWDYETVS